MLIFVNWLYIYIYGFPCIGEWDVLISIFKILKYFLVANHMTYFSKGFLGIRAVYYLYLRDKVSPCSLSPHSFVLNTSYMHYIFPTISAQFWKRCVEVTLTGAYLLILFLISQRAEVLIFIKCYLSICYFMNYGFHLYLRNLCLPQGNTFLSCVFL